MSTIYVVVTDAPDGGVISVQAFTKEEDAEI
jgi:hypothetical protein